MTVLALLRPQKADDILGLEIFKELLVSFNDKLSIAVESSRIDPSVTIVFYKCKTEKTSYKIKYNKLYIIKNK